MPPVDELLSKPATAYKRKTHDNTSELDKLRAAVATYALPSMNKTTNTNTTTNDISNSTTNDKHKIDTNTPHTHQYICTQCGHTIYNISLTKPQLNNNDTIQQSKRYIDTDDTYTASNTELQQMRLITKQLNILLSNMLEFCHNNNISPHEYNDKCLVQQNGLYTLTYDGSDGFVLSNKYKQSAHNHNTDTNMNNDKVADIDYEVDSMFKSIKKHKKSKKHHRKDESENG